MNSLDSNARSNRKFLTAEWRNLVMLNYSVDPSLLLSSVPRGTELDLWHDKAFVSLVGFQFLKTRVFGISFPFHRNFDEINLRFYVKRNEANETRRGVVFIKEIVPRRVIAAVARAFYGENYVSLPMSHKLLATDQNSTAAEYAWKSQASWNKLQLWAAGKPELPVGGSEEQFITEHYWGYASQKDGRCVEYRVEHLPWRVWRAQSSWFEGDATSVYGSNLAATLTCPPTSAFLAEGSPVTVFRGRVL